MVFRPKLTKISGFQAKISGFQAKCGQNSGFLAKCGQSSGFLAKQWARQRGAVPVTPAQSARHVRLCRLYADTGFSKHPLGVNFRFFDISDPRLSLVDVGGA